MDNSRSRQNCTHTKKKEGKKREKQGMHNKCTDCGQEEGEAPHNGQRQGWWGEVLALCVTQGERTLTTQRHRPGTALKALEGLHHGSG